MRTATEALARRLARRDGFVVDRPVGPGFPGRSFPLVVVSSRPERLAGAGRRPAQPPVLFIPGGPGMASVLPYAGLRRLAARHGLEALMVEHRGVGLARQDHAGTDLPVAAVTVEAAADDLAAALTAARVDQVVVYGSSYGSLLAQVLAARHPGRVAALVLDSPLLSPHEDLAAVRTHRRRLLWDGEDPALAPVAAAVRELVADGVPTQEVTAVVQEAHERAGPEALLRMLRARRAGRGLRTWRWIAGTGGAHGRGRGVRYVAEPDLVAGIAFGQLGFGLPPDGGPLDPQLPPFTQHSRAPSDSRAAPRPARSSTPRPEYQGSPLDAPARLVDLAHSATPLVVISGDRDLRTPPAVAERAAALVPGSMLIRLRDTGHSALDCHQLAAVRIATAVAAGDVTGLPALAEDLSDLPRRGHGHIAGLAMSAAITAAVFPPGRVLG